MKRAAFWIWFIILCLNFICSTKIIAREYGEGVPLKNFNFSDNPYTKIHENINPNMENFNEYNSPASIKNNRMTRLTTIKLFDKKDPLAEKIKLRAVQLLKENKESEEYYYFNMAKAYEEQKKYEKAIENYKFAINSNPAYTPAYGALGLVYAVLGQYKNSINVFEKYHALSNNPEEKNLISEFIREINSLIKE